jgi:hypothetical protein
MRVAVVEIAGFGAGRLGARLVQAEGNYLEGLDYADFVFDPGALSTDTLEHVQSYGASLDAALNAHPAIREELSQLIKADSANLEFRIGAADAERLRWEALYMADCRRFVALIDTCLVSRIAQKASAAGIGTRAFSPPLRMAAFVSAVRIPAVKEYEVICAQIRAARQAGLAVECTIYVGEQDILDKAQADLVANKRDGISVLPVPDSALAIGNLLRDQPVELLHFFCHGVFEGGEQMLELATVNDTDTAAPRGSIRLTIERLKQALLSSGRTWLTVLNCCSGAQAVKQLHSMALELAKRASPVTVGMAESVNYSDATFFANALYAKVFVILGYTVGKLQNGDSMMLDLIPAIRSARAALHSLYETTPPEAFGRWTLPVVYRWDASLQVLRVGPEMMRRIRIVAGTLATMPDDTPDDLRDRILASLDDDPPVPPTLRPGRRGLFGFA